MTKAPFPDPTSRLVGFVPTYKYFSGFKFFLLSKRISSRPPAANANR
jgi:hypothetical protein